MGQPDNPHHRALLPHDLPSRVTPLARPQGLLGRMPLRAYSRPRKRESASPFVMLEFEDIRNICEFDRVNKDVTYLDLFKPVMLNRTIIAVFM
jgi:hypothetical protein